MVASYHTQVEVSRAVSRQPRNVQAILYNRWEKLRSLWGDRTNPNSISWSLVQCQFVASEFAFLERKLAEGRSVAEIVALLQDCADKVAEACHHAKSLQNQQSNITAEWETKLPTIRKQFGWFERSAFGLLSSLSRDIFCTPSSSALATRQQVAAVAYPSGIVAIQDGLELNVILTNHLQSLTNFWQSQERMLCRILRRECPDSEVVRYMSEWKQADEASSDALTHIGFAIDSFLRP